MAKGRNTKIANMEHLASKDGHDMPPHVRKGHGRKGRKARRSHRR